ncbi:hypothetical protein BC937DRAFT_92159 [Endogone sp. FLAS-F59071]|nr:hypothetical protein BC937DRAFT_92159 [Endogone sp. FLAS-F59071]|eukprot:RUS21584.1 hypothetical protein BC937DRAFT_92159 [Endogone sp. FLAS-F59071]
MTTILSDNTCICDYIGQIFCNKCASQIIAGDKFNYEGRVRVCNYCLRAMREYDEEQELDDTASVQDLYLTIPATSEQTGFSAANTIGTPTQSSLPTASKLQIPTTPVKTSPYEIAGSFDTPGPSTSSTLLARYDDLMSPLGPPSPADSIHTFDWSKKFTANPFFRPARSRSNTLSSVSGFDDLRFGGPSPSPFPLAGSSPVPFRRTSVSPGPPNPDGMLSTTPLDPEFGPFMNDEEESDLAFDMWNTNPTTLLNFLTFGGLTGGSGAAGSSHMHTGSTNDPIVDTASVTPEYGGSDDESYDYKGRIRSGYQRTEDLRTMFAKDKAVARRRSSMTGLGPRPSRTVSRSMLRHTGSVADTISEGYVPPSPLLEVSSFGLNRDPEPRPESPVVSRHRSLSAPLNVELNEASLDHLRSLLRQMLAEAEGLEAREEWEEVLLKLILRVSDSVHPDIRGGDEIDIRHYVKIKKIPGGEPSDSHYVRGVVCSKNVAHKRMVGTVVNPRILILLFGLEYERVENQFMSITPIIEQEKQHLQMLVARIVNLRPTIVLIKSSVSRLALDFFLKANIPVAYNVKSSVIDAVARCTRAVIIPSIGELSLGDSQLGKCGVFTTRTYIHEWIPNRRKTFLVFDDCAPELGCTIVLRGGNDKALREVKRIMDFMVFVVNNLKLETFLMKDEFAAPGLVRNVVKVTGYDAGNSQDVFEEKKGLEMQDAVESNHSNNNTSLAILTLGDMTKPAESDPEKEALSMDNASYFGLPKELVVAEDERVRGITLALKPYETLILSASPFVKFEPPYLLTRMKEEETKLALLRLKRSLIERNWVGVSRELNASPVATSPGAVGMAEKATNKPISTASSVSSTSGLRTLSTDQLLIEDGEYEYLRAEYDQKLRAYETNLVESSHDVSPYQRQNIVVLYSNVLCSSNVDSGTVPCQGPELRVFEYYRESDITLGQYLEEQVLESSQLCPSKICDRPMLMHYRSYAHGRRRINVVIEQFATPLQGMVDTILMWSFCNLCRKATPVVPMSEETWKYSFGKYLELTFHHLELLCQPDICPHDIHRDHVRYFGYKNVAIRFQCEPIELFEVAVPPMRLFTAPETKIKAKEADNDVVRAKITRYYDSLEKRIKGFDFDVVNPNKVEECKLRLQEMNRRVMTEKKSMLHQLQQVFATTPSADTLSLNRVRGTLQEKVIVWDQEFELIARQYFQPERELRRLTNAQLNKMFPDIREFSLPLTPESFDHRAQRAAMVNDLPLLDIDMENGGVTDGLAGSMYLERRSESFNDDPKVLPQLGTSPTKRDFESLLSATASAKSQAAAAETVESSDSEMAPMSVLGWAVAQEREIGEDSPYFPDESRTARRLSMQMMNTQQRLSQRPSLQRFDSALSSASDIEGGDVEALPTAPSLLAPASGRAVNSLPSTPRSAMPPQSVVNSVKNVTSSVALARRRSNQGAAGTQSASSKGPRRGSEPGDEGGYVGASGRNLPERSPIPNNRPIKALKKPAISRPEPQLGTPGTSRMQRQLGMPTALSLKSSAEDLHDSSSPALKEPVRRNYRIGVKPKSRPIARQRLPSKASIEVYTTVKEVMKEESDEEFGATDVDDDLNDEVEEIHTVSLIKTDAFDESLGHELLATINESRVSGNGYFGSIDAEHVYPLLGHDGDDMPPVILTSEPSTLNSNPSSINPTAATATNTPALALARGIPVSLMASLTAVSTPGGTMKITPQPLFTSTFVQGGMMTPAIGVDRQLGDDYTTGGERISLVRTLTNFWADRGTASLLPLDYPLASTEHVLYDAPIIVREDEPSSIIAYTLSCSDYLNQLQAIQESHAKGEMKMEELNAPEDNDTGSDWVNLGFEDTASISGTSIEKTLLRDTGTHIKYRFSDGTAKFTCQIFYAEQFDALRKNCGCSESFIESLARCVKWESVGGKSRSIFLKTTDDRLLMKQISKLELDAFTRSAPAYFHYMSEAFFHDLPTVFTKIFGFYRISCKNPTTGQSWRLDVLVMENLFYQRSIKKLFDLKGSMRNRRVRSTGRQNEVLLDENMVEFMYRSPLFIRTHSKELLRGSLHNDTLFLVRLKVMDYSLLVGIDEDKHELVVGIVDFIRQFTWDKKIESMVKETGFLGGQNAMPTIVSPKQYRKRFKEAMERYFLMVPDIWSTPRIWGGRVHHHAEQQE